MFRELNQKKHIIALIVIFWIFIEYFSLSVAAVRTTNQVKEKQSTQEISIKTTDFFEEAKSENILLKNKLVKDRQKAKEELIKKEVDTKKDSIIKENNISQNRPQNNLQEDFFESVQIGERKISSCDYNLLLNVCMAEAGNQPLIGKIAVVETILNRYDLGYGSIEKIIKEAYTNVFKYTPNKDVYKAVDAALSSNHFPDNMLYFRTKHYHNFGTPYKKIGDHYFSLT